MFLLSNVILLTLPHSFLLFLSSIPSNVVYITNNRILPDIFFPAESFIFIRYGWYKSTEWEKKRRQQAKKKESENDSGFCLFSFWGFFYEMISRIIWYCAWLIDRFSWSISSVKFFIYCYIYHYVYWFHAFVLNIQLYTLSCLTYNILWWLSHLLRVSSIFIPNQ